MNKTGIITIIVIIAIILIGIVSYVSKDTEMADNMNATTTVVQIPAPTTETNSPATTTGATASSTTKSFTVTGSNFTFSPSVMTVNKGDTVKITFINQTGTHDLKIDGYNVATKVLEAGQQETIEFIANETGVFEFYCSVGNHRAMGMKGTLTVK